MFICNITNSNSRNMLFRIFKLNIYIYVFHIENGRITEVFQNYFTPVRGYRDSIMTHHFQMLITSWLFIGMLPNAKMRSHTFSMKRIQAFLKCTLYSITAESITNLIAHVTWSLNLVFMNSLQLFLFQLKWTCTSPLILILNSLLILEGNSRF